MASPTIESLCCLTSSNKFSQGFLIDFHTIPYNVVSIFSSLLGIGGAIFQMFRKENSNQGRQRNLNRFIHTRGRSLIRLLAFADLMAAIGILVRSVSWVSDKTFGSFETDTILGQVFCIVTSAWIHYFYTATYFWTFIYALDVNLVLRERKISSKLYHAIGWIFPAVLCGIGLLFLYMPDLKVQLAHLDIESSPWFPLPLISRGWKKGLPSFCYSFMVNPYQRFLPNYLSTFIPIVFVMIVNPLLFLVSFSSIEKLLASSTGRFTQRERQIVKNLKIKFLLITLVFYVCWSPNIINGLILWSSWDELPNIVIIIIWYLMAVLNPLQAVLNCFVYRRWDSEVASRRPFWVHPMLWLDHNLSFSGSSSSGYEIDNSYPEEARSGKGFSLYNDASPWQRIPFLNRPLLGKRSSERTPLLTTSPKSSFVVTGEQPESSEGSVSS